jgi:VWFA-related protein
LRWCAYPRLRPPSWFHSADATGIETLLAGKALSPLSSPLRDVYNSDDDAAIEGVYGKMAAAAKIPVDNLEDSQRETEMDRLTMRVILTLESLNSLAAWLEQYPGKKNLFWLSEGFPLTAQPQGFRNPNKVFNSARFRESYLQMQQRTDKRLETARVAVFPIDVRGVISAATEGIDSIDIKGTLYGGPIGPARLNEDTLQADSRVNEERAGMMEIANATGGVATINRNDLAQVLSEKFRQSQTYYTLTYSPQDAKWDGRYRKIDLTVAKHGYRLYYRRGYFAVDRNKAPATSADAFTLAMRHGAPEVSDLLFTAQLDRSVSGHVGLQYNIDARLLAFSESQDQRKAASIDCAVVEYDAAGKLLGSGEIRVDGRITPDQIAKLQTAGFPAHQDVPLMPGAKWLVVGVRDHTAGRFGTLQIPLDSQ